MAKLTREQRSLLQGRINELYGPHASNVAMRKVENAKMPDDVRAARLLVDRFVAARHKASKAVFNKYRCSEHDACKTLAFMKTDAEAMAFVDGLKPVAAKKTKAQP